MQQNIQSTRYQLIITVLIGLSMLFVTPASAQLRQKKSKTVASPPPVEAEKPAGDSKPVLIKKDSSLLTNPIEETKDTKPTQVDNNNPKVNKVSRPVVTGSKKVTPRVEFEVKSQNDIFYSIPVGQNVVLFYPEKKGVVNDQQKWVCMGYDSDFNKIYEKEATFPKTMKLTGYDVVGEDIYLYFAKTRIKDEYRTAVGNIVIATLSGADGNIKKIDSKLPFNCQADMTATPGGIYLSGQSFPTILQVYGRVCWSLFLCYIPICFGSLNVPQYPLLMKVNTTTSGTKVVPFNEKGHLTVKSAQYDPNTNTTDVLVRNIVDKKQIKYTLRTLDENSNFTGSIPINPKDDRTLTSATTYASKDGAKYVAGTYGEPLKNQFFLTKIMNSLSGKTYTTEPPTEGIFFTKIVEGNQTAMNIFPYGKLKNFFNYSEKAANNGLSKSVQRRAKKGLETQTPYLILPHKLIEYNDQIIFIGEAYFPVYIYYYDSQGHMQREFIGWEFTHALIAGFDKDANLIWDNSFQIQSTLTFSLKEHVKVLIQDNKMTLVYAKKGGLYSQVISGSDIIEGRSFTKVDPSKNSDMSQTNYSVDAAYWYDTNFIIFGLQKKQQTKKQKVFGTGDKTRMFYMTKLSY